jgi:hypothetical protein
VKNVKYGRVVFIIAAGENSNPGSPAHIFYGLLRNLSPSLGMPDSNIQAPNNKQYIIIN